MSKHVHRKHANGMNSVHEATILGSVQGSVNMNVDFAIRRVSGTREGVRKGAQSVIDAFLRSGGELPLPDLSQPASVGYLATTEAVTLSVD